MGVIKEEDMGEDGVEAEGGAEGKAEAKTEAEGGVEGKVGGPGAWWEVVVERGGGVEKVLRLPPWRPSQYRGVYLQPGSHRCVAQVKTPMQC
jgi:hypothetical protein